MKPIHTREQLEEELKNIMVKYHYYDDFDYPECAREIADLIADLNGNLCFHSNESDDRR